MTAFDYSRPKSTAELLLARFGQDGAIRRAGLVTGDSWNPTPGVATDTPCTLVEMFYDANQVDGSLIRADDRRCLVSTEGVSDAPTQDDQLVIGGRAFEIVSVMPLSPGGVVLLWKVQARG